MTDNRRYLVSRNKREGWYFNFNGKTRKKGKCFSLASFAQRKREWIKMRGLYE